MGKKWISSKKLCFGDELSPLSENRLSLQIIHMEKQTEKGHVNHRKECGTRHLLISLKVTSTQLD